MGGRVGEGLLGEEVGPPSSRAPFDVARRHGYPPRHSGCPIPLSIRRLAFGTIALALCVACAGGKDKDDEDRVVCPEGSTAVDGECRADASGDTDTDTDSDTDTDADSDTDADTNTAPTVV